MPPSPSDARRKWRKARVPKTTKRHRTDEEDDDDDDDAELDEDEDLHPNPKIPQTRILSESEVLAGAGVRISDFPVAVKRVVNRPHSSVLSIVAAEKGHGQSAVVLENVSYGQLQALSSVPSDNLVLLGSGSGSVDQEGSVVISPPPIREGRGVVKRFWNRVHVVPLHADWFQPTTVHRLERQVVPHFFCGKLAERTPEKYMDCRNLMVAKYMENPEKRLSLEDCQGLVTDIDKEDFDRIFRFLDHWGIINYCAPGSYNEYWRIDAYLREDLKGEVIVPSATLKSIDSLIKFDKPKCRLKPHEVYSLSSNPDELADLDSTIRERFSESRCNYCFRPLLAVHYQSVKEADTSLCPDCYQEGRHVIGHSSMDLMKVDTTKEFGDQDGECWTDQETLMLLEALEMYNDDWNEIAEHVRTKSKAQCILHFLRLPMEDGLLENVEVPTTSHTSNGSHKGEPGRLHLHTNGASSGSHHQDSVSESRFPFANSGNPVMHQVAFLASALGPRVAAACAHASLAVLSEDDRSAYGSRMDSDDGSVDMRNQSPQKEETLAVQGSLGPNNVNADAFPIPLEKVKCAVKAGLAAAAVKAKLFADHEEREIQRLSASIINHQLKRLELKLKQFAEIETLLMKECEQVEKTRQRLAEERARAIAARFGGSSGVASSVNFPGAVTPQAIVNNNSNNNNNNNNMSNNRPPIISAPPSHPSVSGYSNNQTGHSQMPFMPRQQMFSFGPRLPLSAIQPTSSSGPSSTSMFGAQGSAGQPSLGHPMLRASTSGMG